VISKKKRKKLATKAKREAAPVARHVVPPLSSDDDTDSLRDDDDDESSHTELSQDKSWLRTHGLFVLGSVSIFVFLFVFAECSTSLLPFPWLSEPTMSYRGGFVCHWPPKMAKCPELALDEVNEVPTSFPTLDDQGVLVYDLTRGHKFQGSNMMLGVFARHRGRVVHELSDHSLNFGYRDSWSQEEQTWHWTCVKVGTTHRFRLHTTHFMHVVEVHVTSLPVTLQDPTSNFQVQVVVHDPSCLHDAGGLPTARLTRYPHIPPPQPYCCPLSNEFVLRVRVVNPRAKAMFVGREVLRQYSFEEPKIVRIPPFSTMDCDFGVIAVELYVRFFMQFENELKVSDECHFLTPPLLFDPTCHMPSQQGFFVFVCFCVFVFFYVFVCSGFFVVQLCDNTWPLPVTTYVPTFAGFCVFLCVFVFLFCCFFMCWFFVG